MVGMVLAHGLVHAILHAATLLGCSHMERWRGLAWVVDDDVVDVVIVDDVCHVPTLGPSLRALLGLAGRWPAAPQSESLAIRSSGALKTSLILALLSHRVFSQLLRPTERTLLVVSVTANEVIVLFSVLLLLS